MVEIAEAYQDHVPPKWVRSTVERLLQSVPEEFLTGLGTVVMTDSATIGPGKTRRVGGRKYVRKDCLGFYHHGTRQDVAWIELVADNILARVPRPLLAVQFMRDVVVSWTLYHEIGHHLHATLGSRGRSEEGGAEDWRRRLSRQHFTEHYWYLKPVASGIARAVAVLGRLTSRFSGRAFSRR
jgi:hypothetical protein